MIEQRLDQVVAGLAFGFGFVASAIFGLMLFVLCVWQLYDAYVLANLFNRRVQEIGTAPW